MARAMGLKSKLDKKQNPTVVPWRDASEVPIPAQVTNPFSDPSYSSLSESWLLIPSGALVHLTGWSLNHGTAIPVRALSYM